jgi:hypothetical protein
MNPSGMGWSRPGTTNNASVSAVRGAPTMSCTAGEGACSCLKVYHAPTCGPTVTARRRGGKAANSAPRPPPTPQPAPRGYPPPTFRGKGALHRRPPSPLSRASGRYPLGAAGDEGGWTVHEPHLPSPRPPVRLFACPLGTQCSTHLDRGAPLRCTMRPVDASVECGPMAACVGKTCYHPAQTISSGAGC